MMLMKEVLMILFGFPSETNKKNMKNFNFEQMWVDRSWSRFSLGQSTRQKYMYRKAEEVEVCLTKDEERRGFSQEEFQSPVTRSRKASKASQHCHDGPVQAPPR